MTQESSQKLNVRYAGGVTIVSFSSPYLQSESVIENVGAELAELAGDQGHTKMLVSLDGVRFVSSSMLAQLVKLQKLLTKSKGRLRVCSLTPQLREVVRVSQLDKLLDVHDNEEAALTKF